MKFLLPFCLLMILAGLCAWGFAGLMEIAFPDGILVFAPEGSRPPDPSDAFQTGLAVGWFFSFLAYLVLALSLFSFTHNRKSRLATLPAPFFAAGLLCFGLMLLAINMSV